MLSIDADKLMKNLGITSLDCEKCGWGDNHGFCTRGSDFTDVCFAIETMIDENAIEIIECKDCIHWERVFSDDGKFEYVNMNYCKKGVNMAGPNWFCPLSAREEVK